MGDNLRDEAENVFESRILQVIGSRSENVYSGMLGNNKNTYLTDVCLRSFIENFQRKKRTFMLSFTRASWRHKRQKQQKFLHRVFGTQMSRILKISFPSIFFISSMAL